MGWGRTMGNDVKDFEKEVIRRSFEVPVLVDFWAAWCAPCKMLAPALERLAAQSTGKWVLAKVDTESFPDIAARYGIQSIPNVKLFVDGRVLAEFTGALPESAVQQWLDKNLPSKFQKDIDQAETLLRSGLLQEARSLLEPAIKAEPSNDKARVLLALILLEENHKEALNLVEEIELDSEQFEIVEAIRAFSGLMDKADEPEHLPAADVKAEYLEAILALKKRDFPLALEKFISVIKKDRYYDDDGSRKACIAIFKLLGEDHETTQRYRREFSSALY